MTIVPNQHDRGIEADPSDPHNLDADGDGVIDGPLGEPAAPEDAGTD
jgi:hypothetical protein